MRIAYITPYQGPTLIKRRHIVRNRSMAIRTKIELIAQLLRSNSHDVEIFSHGEVIENQLKFYSAFAEPELFHPQIPVYYISALPVRRVNGLWSSLRMLHLLRQRHRVSPFDLVIIFNLKRPQLACTRYAVRHGIPAILEYEDDAFRNVVGELSTGLVARYHQRTYRRVFGAVSGCIAASPHLLSQLPPDIPKLLLRGVVGDDIVIASERQRVCKKNIVLFAGTHIKSNGIEELIMAWDTMAAVDWELHVTGYGEMTEQLRRMAENSSGVVFDGLVSRQQLVCLMCSAKICVNPHALSQTPGNVFAFKIIEYLGAGAHVVTTPMGVVEPEIEAGITYMADNRPETIAAALKQVIGERRYEYTAERATQERYGSRAVAEDLELLLNSVVGVPRRPRRIG